MVRVAWRVARSRQAVRRKSQKTRFRLMRRLAAVHASPDGFWKNPKTRKEFDNG